MQQILAPIAGIVVGGLVVAAIEAVGHAAYPVPSLAGADLPQIRAAIAALPVGALLFPLAAWCLGAFAGAATAIAVARRRPWLQAGIVGGVLLAATVGNLIAIPHPLWMMVLGPVGIAAATWAAVRVVGGRWRGSAGPSPSGR